MRPPLSRFAINAPPFVCASSPSQAPDSRAMIGPGAAPCHHLIISGIKLSPWLQTGQRQPSEAGTLGALVGGQLQPLAAHLAKLLG